MRFIFLFTFIVCSTFLAGQTREKFSFVFLVHPELTFHKNDYAYRSRSVYTKSTFNIGIEAGLRCYLTIRLFTEAGIGYIPRKLNTLAFLDQSAIPPPRQSPTGELVGTSSVSFRTIQFPLSFGYNIIQEKNLAFFVKGGWTGNYLLNTYYGITGFSQYAGSYKKNHWQGYSLSLGLGSDHEISKKLTFTSRVSYSIKNTVKEDEYLFSQDEYVIPLPHTYLRLSVGLRMSL